MRKKFKQVWRHCIWFDTAQAHPVAVGQARKHGIDQFTQRCMPGAGSYCAAPAQPAGGPYWRHPVVANVDSGENYLTLAVGNAAINFCHHFRERLAGEIANARYDAISAVVAAAVLHLDQRARAFARFMLILSASQRRLSRHIPSVVTQPFHSIGVPCIRIAPASLYAKLLA